MKYQNSYKNDFLKNKYHMCHKKFFVDNEYKKWLGLNRLVDMVPDCTNLEVIELISGSGT